MRSHDDGHLVRVTHVRSHVRLMTEATTFAINARKAIEIASLISPTIIAHARATRVHSTPTKVKRGISGQVVQMSCRDFWWILSRIIHSVRLKVIEETIDVEATEIKIYSTNRMRAIGFASDFDRPTADVAGYTIEVGTMHYVLIEDFVGAYSGRISVMIDEAITTLRPNR